MDLYFLLLDNLMPQKYLEDIIKSRIFAKRILLKEQIMRLSEERYDNPAYRDIKNSIDTAKEEGREEGRVEGIAKEKLATAKRLLGMGLTQEQVAKGTDLSIEDIERLV